MFNVSLGFAKNDQCLMFNVLLGFAAWHRQECLTFIACKDNFFSLNHQINI